MEEIETANSILKKDYKIVLDLSLLNIIIISSVLILFLAIFLFGFYYINQKTSHPKNQKYQASL